VQANVRGGGEFGQPWHGGGRGRNKGNSFDDFNACAEFLIDNNYTSAGRIVSEGHSNGGLLVLGAMQRRPDLYGAVMSGAPVADMTSENYRVTATEYGDPFKDKDDFLAIKKIAPLLNVKPGEKLPPVLVHTGLKDCLLIRGALKLVATLQHANPDNTVLLHVEKDYGHALNRPADIAINEIIARKSFIERSIGPISQKDYAALLTAQPKAQQYNA
jgi:prolyl oligopeptidase